MLLSRQEMVAVVDRHTSTLATGQNWVFVGGIREELEYQWAFDELQVQRILFDMQDEGLIW
tara:strand:- start:2938 stop:3120 length:183 start_codon:yes stop_codon:yes gene_type:complete